MARPCWRKPDEELRSLIRASRTMLEERARRAAEEARIEAHPVLALVHHAKSEGWFHEADRAEAWLARCEAEAARYRAALGAVAAEGHDERCVAELTCEPSEHPALCTCFVGRARKALGL